MKYSCKPPNNFSESFFKKKKNIKNSLFEVEYFLEKTTSLSDIFKILKIIKKHD